MITRLDRPANVVGALSIAIVDRIQRAVFEGTGLGGEAVAALIAIGHTPGMTITQLGGVLSRSHPGTVRIVDRLAAALLLERNSSSHDRRTVTLTLTEKGLAERAAVLDRRHTTLEDILGLMAPDDVSTFERIAADILGALPDDATTAMAICRYCDERRCTVCPMTPFGSLTVDDSSAHHPA